MRHEKAQQLVELCTMIVGAANGISLKQIQEKFYVSTRTAERMRDAALRMLPDNEELRDGEGRKRWRAPELPRRHATLATEDIAAMRAAADMLKGANRQDEASSVQRIADMLLALQSTASRRRIAPDLELLMQTEAIVHRVGPVIKTDPNVQQSIRTAILGSRILGITYCSRSQIENRTLDVEPYGLLYGLRPYLVGKVVGEPDFRHFRLDGIKAIAALQRAFIRDPDFVLEDYRSQFFGSLREAPVENVWRFKPEVAKIAAEYVFHPKQATEWLDDGSLVVRFRAGGRQEMASHLAGWGNLVEVIS